jgi:hypothetical protein
MANGSIINSLVKWLGMIEINGVRAKGEFEVFNSSGGWGFLFGKPVLQVFRVIHKYETDTIHISDQQWGITLSNQIMDTPNKKANLMLDNKQWENVVGGLETSPSGRVLTTPSNSGIQETNNESEHTQTV